MFVVAAAFLVAASADACALDDEVRAEMRQMPYTQFDQTHGDGWRRYGEDNGCFAAAHDLIKDYILFASTPLTDFKNLRTLRWHAGQMAAMAGDEARALDYFQATYEPAEDRTDYLDWNSYVDATVAFLKKDRAALERAREKLAEQKPFDNGYYPNLNIADGFLRCFDKSYSEAYSPDCQSDGKTP